jgi:hypothetical protein
MLSSTKRIRFTHKESSGASWITTFKPEAKLARSNSLFDYHPRYYVTEGYQDIGQRDLFHTALENRYAFGYPTRKAPAPLGDLAYRIPRSGNQPTVVGTYGPDNPPVPLEYIPESLGGKMTAGGSTEDTVIINGVPQKVNRQAYQYYLARRQAARQNDPSALTLGDPVAEGYTLPNFTPRVPPGQARGNQPASGVNPNNQPDRT